MMGDLAVYAPGAQIALRVNSADPNEAMVWGTIPTPPTAPPASSDSVDTITRLEQLGVLRDTGAISAEEFEHQKARILDGR
jgi:Short C-terminal domain